MVLYLGREWARKIPVLLLLLLMLGPVIPGRVLVPAAHSVSSVILSSVYVDPVSLCCVFSNSTSAQVTVNVLMSLIPGDVINGFDVRLNYTNAWTPLIGGVVTANSSIGIDYGNNVFAGRNVVTSAACIDNVIVVANALCATDDASVGQVHFAQTLIGENITGPVNGRLLFSLVFSVKGIGTSVFSIERANLVSPHFGPKGPDPKFLQVVTGSGVFGNSPLVAFFDYRIDGIPSIVSGRNVTFDASRSFRVNAGSSTPTPLASAQYAWNFSDGTPAVSGTSPSVSHRFESVANFMVKLTVHDLFPGAGNVQRTVIVIPPLGGLYIQVKNSQGAQIQSIVTVKVLNNTLPETSCGMCNKTISAGGVVQFKGLTPGQYTLKFTGTYVDTDREPTEVSEGWTTQQTVYLAEHLGGSSNDLPLYVFAGSMIAGLGLVGAALFRRQRKLKLENKPSETSVASGKTGRRKTSRH